jgi:hypothetical protein
MILRQPVFGTIEVLAIVAPERKVNFHPASFTFHKLKLPSGDNILLLLTFNVGTAH